MVLALAWAPVPEKPGVFKETIQSLSIEGESGGKMIKFDSSKPADKENPVDSFLRALLGADTVTVDPMTLEVKDVKGAEEAVKNLAPAETKAAVLGF